MAPQLAEILLDPQPTPAWRQLRQVGIDRAVGVLPRRLKDWRGDDGEVPWGLAPLSILAAMVEAEGFALEVIEDNPPMDRIRLGRPGREEELEQFALLVRSMGRLGIPVLCYNWSALLGWVRTELAARGRGGAIVAGFDAARFEGAEIPLGDGEDEAALWENLRWFLERIVPVAEEAGVRLAMHPDDPPLSPVRGVPRIMRSVEAFERLLELHDSPANGITFCQGNVALMTADVPAAIDRMTATGRVHFVHFRDVRGTPSGSSRRSTTRARPTCSRACAPTWPAATTACCGPITTPCWKETRPACPAIRTSAGCTRSATCRACSKQRSELTAGAARGACHLRREMTVPLRRALAPALAALACAAGSAVPASAHGGPSGPPAARPAVPGTPQLVRDPDGVPVVARYDVAAYGADATGRADSYAAIQRALDAAGADGGGVVWIGAGSYRVATPLWVPRGVTLLGAWRDPDKGGRRGDRRDDPARRSRPGLADAVPDARRRRWRAGPQRLLPETARRSAGRLRADRPPRRRRVAVRLRQAGDARQPVRGDPRRHRQQRARDPQRGADLGAAQSDHDRLRDRRRPDRGRRGLAALLGALGRHLRAGDRRRSRART